MEAYHLYGFRIRSRWPLPGPKVLHGSPVAIEISERTPIEFSEASVFAENGEWFQRVSGKDGCVYLRWSGLFEFLISADGRRISGRPLSGSSSEAFATYLAGQVLSFALVKQGIEPLHATVVVVDGMAVALCGDCGYGKS